jgi:hypothetical protein
MPQTPQYSALRRSAWSPQDLVRRRRHQVSFCSSSPALPRPHVAAPSHCRAGSARRRPLPERRTGPARCRRKSGRRAGSRRWSPWSAPRPLRPSGCARVQASGAKEERSASAQRRRGRPPWCHRHLQQEKLILQ